MNAAAGMVDLAGLTTVQVRSLFRADPHPVLFLVLGATEAHGPHLPLVTDTVIGAHLARTTAHRLHDQSGVPGLLAPVFTTTAAACAAELPGTVHHPGEVEREALSASLASWWKAGAKRICLLTLHFDPDHLKAVHDVIESLEAHQKKQLVFSDFTRRENARLVAKEFATGDCHAGEFETSLMLVAAPEAVDPLYARLPARKVGLVQGIRDGKRSFKALGMPQGYCGSPADATVEEGERLFDILSEIAVRDCRGAWLEETS